MEPIQMKMVDKLKATLEVISDLSVFLDLYWESTFSLIYNQVAKGLKSISMTNAAAPSSPVRNQKSSNVLTTG